MILNELQATLNDAIFNRTLILGPETVKSENILEIFESTTGTDQLTITEANIPVISDSGLAITGKSSLFGLTNVNVEGLFAVIDNQVTFSMKIRLPSTWKFSQSFVSLSHLTDPFPTVLRGNQSLFDTVNFIEPMFILSSVAYEDPEFGIDIAKGLNFTAIVTLTGPVAAVKQFLDYNAPLRIAGTVGFQRVTDSPDAILSPIDIDLTALIPVDFNLGELTVEDLRLNLACLTYSEDLTVADVQIMSWLSLDGVCEIGGTSVMLSAVFPSDETATIEFTAIFDELEIPSLSELTKLIGGDYLQGMLPEPLRNLGGVWVSEIGLGFSPVSKEIKYAKIGIETTQSWTIIPNVLEINKVAVQWLIFEPLVKSRRSMSGFISGDLGIDSIQMQVVAEMPHFHVRAQMTEGAINLSSLFEHFLTGNVSLPDEVPSIEISDINVSVTPQTGEFSLSGQCTATWELPFGVAGLSVSTVTLSLSQGPSTGTGPTKRRGLISCSLQLSGQGPIPIVEGLIFNRFDLAFDLMDERDWALSGNIAATVFDADYSLAAGLEVNKTMGRRTIKLAATRTASQSLVDIPGTLSLEARSLEIEISKRIPIQGTGLPPTPPPVPDPTSPVQQFGASDYTWQVSASGTVVILKDLFSSSGTLQLYRTDTRTGLALKSDKTQLKIPLSMIPENDINLFLGFNYVAVVRVQDDIGPTRWEIEAAAALWFTGLAQNLDKVLADRIEGRLRIDGSGLTASVLRVAEPTEIALPDIRMGNAVIDLGQMLVDASNLSLQIGQQFALSIDFGLGIPSELNKIFGTKRDGQPAMRFFNTYQPGKPETITRFRLQVTSAAGLTIQVITSPIAAIRFVIEGLDTWAYTDFGEFGKAKFMVPIFSYDGVNFRTRGGFQQVEPLQIPLTPLILLLEACQLDVVAQALPAGLPLKEINVVDEAGNLLLDEFVQELETMGDFEMPNQVTQALAIIADRFDELPEQFRNYLHIEIPDNFMFDIRFSPDGGAKVMIKVQDDEPLKLMYPTTTPGPMGIPIPSLLGVELYSFTFGEILSGSLFLLNIDARIDHFDFLTLAATLLLPLDELPILPDATQLNRSLIIDDLFMLLIYQTGIPVPIPLFFDELRIEYLGLEGLAFQTHWGWPKPRINMGEASRLFREFEYFFTDANYLLDANNPPEDLDLVLTTGPNYIQLPEYLGSKMLGDKEDTVELSVYQGLAHLLNGLKTLSLNEFIQAVPLEKRVGSQSINFASIVTLEASWLVTTPAEFRNTSYKQLNLAAQNIETTLAVLPDTPSKKDEGLVIFMRGAWAVNYVAEFESWFGLVGTGQGFATALRISGSIGENLLKAELGGLVVIDSENRPHFNLQGYSRLNFFGETILSGDLQITDDSFWIKGKLDLFPAIDSLQVGGEVEGFISRKRFKASGQIVVKLGDYAPFGQVDAELTDRHIMLAAQFLGQKVAFFAGRHQEMLVFTAALTAGITVNKFTLAANASLFLGLQPKPNKPKAYSPVLYLEGNINILDIASASTTVMFSQEGFNFTVTGQVFGLFTAALQAYGKALHQDREFGVAVTITAGNFFDQLGQASSTLIILTALNVAQGGAKAAEEILDTAEQALVAPQACLEAAKATVELSKVSLDVAKEALDGTKSVLNGAQEVLTAGQKVVEAAEKVIGGILDGSGAIVGIFSKSAKEDLEKAKRDLSTGPFRKAKDDLEKDKKKIGQEKTKIDNAKKDVQDTERSFDAAKDDLSAAQDKINQAKTKLGNKRQALERARSDLASLKDDLTDQLSRPKQKAPARIDNAHHSNLLRTVPDVAQASVSVAEEVLSISEKALGVPQSSLGVLKDIIETGKVSLNVAEEALDGATAGLKGIKGTLTTAQKAVETAEKVIGGVLDGLGAVVGVFSKSAKEDLEDAKRDLSTGPFNKAKDNLENEKKKIGQEKTKINDAKDNVQEAEDSFDAAKDRVSAAQGEINQAKTKLGNKRQRFSEAQADLEKFEETITYLAKPGGQAPIRVEQAGFRGQLRAVGGGQVSLELKVSSLGKRPKPITMDYNFYQPKTGIEELGKLFVP